MDGRRPGPFTIVRAPGLIATFFPLTIGTAAVVASTGEFSAIGAFLAAVVGISLHLSMNVYNDIFDTRQGSDTLESSRCFFSGGSGTLITNPELEGVMFLIARAGIMIGLLGTVGLMLISERGLWPIFILVYVIAVFLCKYYSAKPVALSYRGLGEVAVFIAFGPLAILLAAASQGVVPDLLILAMMPLPGIVTVIVTLNGQIVDLPFDEAAGKTGLVMILGMERALHLTMALCALAIVNILAIASITANGWILTVLMLPFIAMLPLAFRYLYKGLSESEYLKKGATILFSSMVICAISMMLGFTYLVLI